MSLVGRLEDLNLGDILQIVSLSRRSGILTINSKKGIGKIAIKNGQVIYVTSNSAKDNIAQLLVKNDILKIDYVKEAIELWNRGKGDIKEIITKKYNISTDIINNSIRDYIEQVIFDMFNWNDGDFNFEIEDADNEIEKIKKRGLEAIYEPGINPQYLAIEGLRIFDEYRRDKEETSEMLTPSEKLPYPESLEFPLEPTVVIIDDDPSIIKYVSEILIRERHKVYSFTSIGTALAKIDELKEIGITPIIISDLLIPRMDGNGLLGGIEILEIIRTIYPDIHFILMSEEKNENAEKEAKRLRVDIYINKPKMMDSNSMELFTKRIIKELSNISSKEDKLFDIREELKDEIEFEYESVNYVTKSPSLSLLKSMITELNNVNTSNEIILLILRFASELMNRAVLFLVKDNYIAGLGQFGIELKDDIPDKRVRNMRIPLTEDSIFLEVMEKGFVLKKSLEDNKWNNYIINEIGGMTPKEVFVAPIVSEGRIIAFLYGDNLSEDREIGDTESIEIFLSQAGVSMEKILLKEKVKTLKKGI